MVEERVVWVMYGCKNESGESAEACQPAGIAIAGPVAPGDKHHAPGRQSFDAAITLGVHDLPACFSSAFTAGVRLSKLRRAAETLCAESG
jgi:hypothetical protein